MNKTIPNYAWAAIAAMVLCSLSACNNYNERRGEPVLSHAAPLFDEVTQTYSLLVSADSVSGADLTFTLCEGSNVLMENHDGRFSGIAPFEEGYSVKMNARWRDTTIVRTIHVMNFITPRDSVDKLSADELEQLINSCDRSIRRGTNIHLAQGVKAKIVDSKMAQLQTLPNVVLFIENEVWQAVEIIDVEYDMSNLVTSVTLKVLGEQVTIDEDDKDYDY